MTFDAAEDDDFHDSDDGVDAILVENKEFREPVRGEEFTNCREVNHGSNTHVLANILGIFVSFFGTKIAQWINVTTCGYVTAAV